MEIYMEVASLLFSYGIQLHLIGKGFLRWQKLLPLQIRVHHNNGRFFVCQFPDNAGQLQLCNQGTRQLAAVTGDHFVMPILFGTHDGRNQNAMLLYALCHLNHVVIHADFEGVIGEIVNLVNGDFLHYGLTGNIPLLLGGEQAID